MVGSAQGCEIAGPGLTRWSAVFDRQVLGDVVEVAGPGVAAAAGEDAVGVAQDHGLAHRFGRVVLVHGPVGVEVEDGAQGDLGAGCANRVSQSVSSRVVAAPSFSIETAPVPSSRSAARSAGVRWT